jgi:outer membrane PBP1 activator LpoA protein
MKTTPTIIGTMGLAALLCAGCGKSETSPASTAGGEDAMVVEEVSIQETVTETADAAKQAVKDAAAQAQELLARAQKLVAEKKYEEAGPLLQQLASFKLTPEQQKTFDSLKATLQKAMETQAVKEGTKAVGNLLGGEK